MACYILIVVGLISNNLCRTKSLENHPLADILYQTREFHLFAYLKENWLMSFAEGANREARPPLKF